MKELPKLTDLDRLNLQELITDVRLETLKKVVHLMIENWLIEITPGRVREESEFDYIWRQATREAKGDALLELLLRLEVESYPEEKPKENAEGV